MSYESKLKAPTLPKGSPTTSKTAAKANLYDQTFLERDTEDILKEYHSNPFFRAKLNYSLQTHTKNKATSLPAHTHQTDALLSTHRHSCKSRDELLDSKVAEIV
jgi:outer membrane protein assembly factor BamA